MENFEEHAKIVSTTATASTTASSPNTTQNDCYDDDREEHVINQNKQSLKILNANVNILDLTESRSATRSETNDNSSYPQELQQQQEQVELETHVESVGSESKNFAVQDKPTGGEQPVDLTSANVTQMKSEDKCLEYQTEPFNLKIDAVASRVFTAEAPKSDNEPSSKSVSSSIFDIHKNMPNETSEPPPASTTIVADTDDLPQSVDVLLNQPTSNEAAVFVDKVNEQTSILDLRINNVDVGPASPSFQAYQTGFSDIKVENTLESQESVFQSKETQMFDKAKSPVKLNGTHQYSPTASCETNNFPTKLTTPSDNATKILTNEFVKESATELDALPENRQEDNFNSNFPKSYDNSAEQPLNETFETAANNTASTNELETAANNTASTNELNESRYSSSDSLNSASTLQSSSSHQLVIDQPAEDDKVPPLRLKLKRKLRKSYSSLDESTQPAPKRALIAAISNENINAVTAEESRIPASITNESLLPICALPVTTVVDDNENAEYVENAVLPPLQPYEAAHEAEKLTPQVHSTENLGFENDLQLTKLPTESSAAAQYYKCTACGTFHENWSFFLHLQEKHDRFLCLYCIKCFPTAEKLALHLEIKHDLEQNHFNTEEAFRNSALVIHGFNLETRFLMCCTCQYIFRENAAFTEHVCIEFMKSCLMCGQKGRHSNQCKANPLAKRRNKKKIRQKHNTMSIENATTALEAPTLLPPPPALPPPAALSALPSVLPELAAPTEQHLTTPLLRRHSEDSNSSSNMVIDESCNTSHNLLPNQINPFKALDETERLERERECEEAAETQDFETETNNVFKFKLRVPKEFQKPVDEEISTSESEHGVEFDEETAADINSNQVEFKNNQQTQLQSLAINSLASNNEKSLPPSEEESFDDTSTNAHLARILQEIEQTKLDIEKTKETLQQRHAHQLQQQQSALEISKQNEVPTSNATAVAATNENEHWTPTPPASPALKTNEPPESLLVTELPSQTNAAQMMAAEEQHLPPTLEENSPLAIAATPPPPDDGIEVANEDCLLIELQLDRPLDQFETVELVRICLKAAYPFCLYCNHARRIAVNAESLVLHLIAQHRFSATVDSITAEELRPSTLVAKLKSFLPELQAQYMNSSSYCTIGEGRFTRHFNERIFECFQCRFATSTHKELYLHNRKMHLRTAILCFMCRCNFYSFSEILCHICPGVPHRVSIFEVRFRCCLCDLTDIPSPFRLMVHLRKRHFACDVCLEDCRDQSKLSSHVWKHKLHHLCYRCGIAYRNKLDITKHLFWKHGTESALCKRCLQKRWPHVYHFCVPPAIFSCDVCQLCFSKAMYLTVHKRLHQNDFRYACNEAGCQEKFISRKLLLKHGKVHETAEQQVKTEETQPELSENKENKENSENEVLHTVNEQKPKLEAEAVLRTESEKIKNEAESIKDEQAGDKASKTNPSKDEHLPTPQTVPTVPTAAATNEQLSTEKKHKKRKKRAKESLEDLNLTAPNLSESGSSSESESETKSNIAPSQLQELALSPLSEHGEQKTAEQIAGGEHATAGENSGNVLDIWKNLLQAQQQTNELQQYAEYTEDDYPAPKCLHVCISDHDYCLVFTKRQEQTKTPTPPKAKHESTSGRGRNFSTSSEESSDDSSSSSSCSCSSSNCSCSNGSSSSSSSGDSSDSSAASNSKKRLRKKSERSNRHRKSFSSSPLKTPNMQHNTSGGGGEHVNVIDTDENVNAAEQLQLEAAANAEETPNNLEPQINESDLETAESETDEEYYDEHPQKLATELLSQKRAQLMARTLLSPSHNFDIVENSRPSTPSLPEDMVYEKRQKKKKNKRERKSTSNNNNNSKQMSAAAKANELHQYLTAAQNNAEPGETTATEQQQGQKLHPPPTATAANHYIPRISEGSSCSDADTSLKRSKRQRRPNKFYGYTSDDESMAPLGQSLVIGMRAYKPLPPPQLVWDKEDLPTPDKSILNVSKKPSRQTSLFNTTSTGGMETSTKKKRPTTHRKRSSKHATNSEKLPPIPRLKIRPALFNKSLEASDLGLDYSSDSASTDNEPQTAGPPPRKRTFPPKQQTATQAGSTLLQHYAPLQQPQPQQPVEATPLPPTPTPIPTLPQLPPTPQTTAFNHRIPPALLPNPDFSTLQYFKANNIRYPIRPPAGARAAREGESVYCYCRCPYDEVSEMIACDGDSCLIEWFHFECVGIMLAPQGKWFCAECRPQYSEELYPTTSTTANTATSNFT